MAAPIVSWYNQANDAAVTELAFGTIDAGTISASTTLLIWNNRAGVTPLSDMTNCSITTKDDVGGNLGELVEDKWVEVRVDSMSEAVFTAIGGTTTKQIKASGEDTGTISGAINDGVKGNSTPNFAEVTFQANVPVIATAGNTNFLVRVAYQYV